MINLALYFAITDTLECSFERDAHGLCLSFFQRPDMTLLESMFNCCYSFGLSRAIPRILAMFSTGFQEFELCTTLKLVWKSARLHTYMCAYPLIACTPTTLRIKFTNYTNDKQRRQN